jgi:C1A family cysteine protease
MVRATIAATLLATVCATTSDSFEAYKAKFDKVYKSVADEAHAADCWKENVQGIQQRQSMNSLAEFDENDFTDLCWEDFERERLGAKFEEAPKMPRKFHPDATTAIRDILEANPSVDWRTSGALAPVQDQGQCGSCWSFGTTAAIEAQHFLWAESGKGKFVKLSEQELVSCDHFKDNTGEDKGCQGGWPERVYHWMLQNNGLTTEQNYPYTSGGGQDGTCLTSAETPKAFNIKDFHDLGADEEYVAAYVAKYGPVTIGAQATGDWQSYKGGILTTGCGSKQANHAIAIIGYGSEAGQDYWLIRNSWGTSWGENGHLRLARGRNCNGVVGHVSSTLFGERSLCLEECGSKMCCGGDCCDDGGRETCCSDNDGTAKGCATSGQ